MIEDCLVEGVFHGNIIVRGGAVFFQPENQPNRLLEAGPLHEEEGDWVVPLREGQRLIFDVRLGLCLLSVPERPQEVWNVGALRPLPAELTRRWGEFQIPPGVKGSIKFKFDSEQLGSSP